MLMMMSKANREAQGKVPLHNQSAPPFTVNKVNFVRPPYDNEHKQV